MDWWFQGGHIAVRVGVTTARQCDHRASRSYRIWYDSGSDLGIFDGDGLAVEQFGESGRRNVEHLNTKRGCGVDFFFKVSEVNQQACASLCEKL